MARIDLVKIENATREAIDTADDLSNLSIADIQKFSDAAIMPLKDTIIKMLLQNLKASGVGTITPEDKYSHKGLIKRGVQGSIISATVGQNKVPKIKVQMPPNMPDYVTESKSGKSHKSSFYVVAGAQSFGAVRVPKERRQVFDLPTGKVKTEKRSVIGAKAKRTVKKYALGQTVSDRAINAVEQGQKYNAFLKKQANSKKKRKAPKIVKGFNIGQVAKETSTSVKMSGTGGAVIIKPRPFYELTSAQKQEISSKFIINFLNLVTKRKG